MRMGIIDIKFSTIAYGCMQFNFGLYFGMQLGLGVLPERVDGYAAFLGVFALISLLMWVVFSAIEHRMETKEGVVKHE